MSDDEKRLVKFDVVLAISGVTRATIYRWMDDGHFPKPVTAGPYPNTPRRWLLAHLNRWLQQKLAGQDWTPPE